MSVQTSELRGTVGIVRCLYILPVGVEDTIFAAAVFRGFPKEHCAVEFQWISCGTMHMCVVLNNVLEFKMQHVQHPVGRATYTADKSSVAHVVSGLFWHIGGGHCQKYAKHCCWKVPCQTFCRCFLRAAARVPDGRTSSKVVSTPNHPLAKHTSAVLVDRWGGARQNIFHVPWMKIEMRWGREVSQPDTCVESRENIMSHAGSLYIL